MLRTKLLRCLWPPDCTVDATISLFTDIASRKSLGRPLTSPVNATVLWLMGVADADASALLVDERC